MRSMLRVTSADGRNLNNTQTCWVFPARSRGRSSFDLRMGIAEPTRFVCLFFDRLTFATARGRLTSRTVGEVASSKGLATERRRRALSGFRRLDVRCVAWQTETNAAAVVQLRLALSLKRRYRLKPVLPLRRTFSRTTTGRQRRKARDQRACLSRMVNAGHGSLHTKQL